MISFLIWNQALSYGAVSVKDLRLPKDFIPTEDPKGTIQSVQENSDFPGFLNFSVSSPHGDYTVQGLADLRQTLHEIDVIEQLDANKSTGGSVADGATESIKDTGRGLKNLVVHPVTSVKGIGKGAGKLGGAIGGAFRKKEEGEKSSMGETFLGSTKRQLAKQIGVDVYSRNTNLQERLDKIAKARMGGRGAVMVVQLLIPVGLVASAVLTVSGINNAADQLVNDNSRGDLFKLNETALLKAGFAKEEVTRFLNHPYYTPRELTYLRFYIEKLQGVPGFRPLLEAASSAVAEVPAQKLLHEMQIAADSLTVTPNASEVRLIPEGLVLVRSNEVSLITGYDHLDASGIGKKVADQAWELKLKLGKKSVEILNAGSLSNGFTMLLLTKGIQSRRMCLFENKTATEQPL